MKRNLLLVFFSILSSFAFSQPNSAKFTGNNFSDSSEIIKPASLKRNAVRIYPIPSYGKIGVRANSTEHLDFYIFDLDGTLVYQAALKNKESRIIDNLKKGTYLYDVFEKDESIEEGKIIIK